MYNDSRKLKFCRNPIEKSFEPQKGNTMATFKRVRGKVIKSPPNCIENSGRYFADFSSYTGIHGLKFLGEPRRSILERIWWLLVLLLALYLCITKILSAYMKWTNSPVIVTFATAQTNIWEIPFPAVTICPEVKSNRNIFNYTDVYYKKILARYTTPDEDMNFLYMSLLCFPDYRFINETSLYFNESALEFLTKVSPKFSDKINILWKGIEVTEQYHKYFTPVLTNEGVCYTFNILDRSEIFKHTVQFYEDDFFMNGLASNWSIDSGYPRKEPMETFPRRTFIAGRRGGLTIIFDVLAKDLDYICGDTLQGFKISLHHPAEIPQVHEKHFRLPLDESLVAAIKPNMMTTSLELKNYKPEDRQCFFSNEKELKYFKIYTQQNCLTECLTNYTLNKCGCVGFYMPKASNTLLCGPANGPCLDDANGTQGVPGIFQYKAKHSNEFLNAQVAKQLNNYDALLFATNPNISITITKDCECLPSCNSIDFDVETSQSDWQWKKYYHFQKQTFQSEDKDLEDLHMSRLSLYFKDMQFITSERKELYGETDFWANCGGLLGLFTGFSIISAFEIFYYLTLRLFFNIRKFGTKNWSGSDELKQREEQAVK